MWLLDQDEIHKNSIGDNRSLAAEQLRFNFSKLPNKNQAWQDLHRLTQDGNLQVRQRAAIALGSVFSYIPDKDQAWQDLIRLIQNQDLFTKVYADLESAFSQVPDKDRAWQDLIRLTQNENAWDRWGAAKILGSVVSYVSDKDPRQDLIRLTQDQDDFVRAWANHAMGRASVFRATAEHNDKDALKKELEAAVYFFEKSSQESDRTPARFCYLFYRTYLGIIFQGAKEVEVQRYLSEARDAVGDSTCKDELLKVVENLARALQGSQRLKSKSVEEISSELNACRWYCDKAAEYMDAVEDKAPGAVKLMRKCNPLLEERIHDTIVEIQDITRQICQLTTGKGPGAEAFCGQIKGAARSLSEADLNDVWKIFSDFDSILREKCVLLTEGERDLVRSQLNGVTHTGPIPEKLDGVIPEKLDGIKKVVKFYLSRIQKDDEFLRRLGEMDEKLGEIHEINNKLDYTNNILKEIRYSVFKQRISSVNAISDLMAMKTELEKLHQIALQHPNSSLKELYSCNEEQLQELSRDMDNRFFELNEILKTKASTEDIKKLERLKPVETGSSKFWDRADKGATLLTYISFLQDSIVILRPLLIG